MKNFVIKKTHLVRNDNDAVGGKDENKHVLGSVFVSAKSKADAIAAYSSLGYRASAARCTVATGDVVEALKEVDLISEDSLTLIPESGWNVGRVSIDSVANERVAIPIGRLEYRSDSGLVRRSFVSSEALV